MITELAIAAKMHRCQKVTRNLFSEGYPVKIKPYKEILQAVMKKENLSEIMAVLFVCEADEIKYNGMAVMLFVSAAVDLMEA